jgi:hypothetical protein
MLRNPQKTNGQIPSAVCTDLKSRIRAILPGGIEYDLRFAKKALLATAGVVAIVGPIAVTVLSPRLLHADSLILPVPGQPRLSFEVASVKPVDRALMSRNHEGKPARSRLTIPSAIDNIL